MAFLGYYLFSQRKLRSHVSVTEDGIVQRIGHTVKKLSWSEIGDVSPCIINDTFMIRIVPTPYAQIAIDTGKSVIDRWQRGLMDSSIDIPAWVMKIDPALYLYIIKFYLKHSEARRELASDEVLSRIRRGDLVE
jgi:hypothetical protein